jgi:mersacidin/lichenicidin family type 2 lantibiotic
MSEVNVVRAWKDEEYRNGLTEAERARLPENPAGLLGQTEAELERAVGGYVVTVYGCWVAPITITVTVPVGSNACTTNGVLTTSVIVQTINQYGFAG